MFDPNQDGVDMCQCTPFAGVLTQSSASRRFRKPHRIATRAGLF
jgi:hypothetical protein